MRSKIKDLIDEWDPADLLCIYCPPDEYEKEIEKIFEVLNNVKDIEELAVSIHNIFTLAFREENPKWDYAKCLIIAKKIMSFKEARQC